ncbi:uncharacterized membrane protein YsdA (DUF1294 family) [Chryseobacterium sp. H1D6B]|uniref:DUF1294 domain-containing protein n=1 Tax=Chryseobacterium sp. H1D6B TaxID=2940588 RepID=UPI0015C8F199|nr:DUF1294 domain-containing protein [Chryseobacterium sp. H1D6B]MDH6254115.1 uncharacterized membrane protein YsdA (DUF1294 family) [Chryseobacterium sp. H1D6B]
MIFYLFLINAAAFLVFGYDKFLAKHHKRRISELMLLFVTFIGGTAGALLGMAVFRHKVSKKSFILKFGLVVLVQIMLIFFFEKYI